MGVVLLIMMVYVGVSDAVAATGMKPEKTPVMLEWRAIGWHGWSKVDWVTVWFAGANWNCTISPTAAVIEFGEYSRVPFAFPTLTTWTVVAARALPMLKVERAKVVNCILAVVKKDPDLS